MMVLLPIKQKYCDLIFEGSKRFEFRKRLPLGLKKGDEVAIYCGSPTSAVVGYFKVAEVVSDAPWKVWYETQKHAGMRYWDFTRYFLTSERANAIKIGQLYEIPGFLSLAELRGSSTAPQSFVYLTKEQAQKVRDLAYRVEFI